jgi:hypothetical protein
MICRGKYREFLFFDGKIGAYTQDAVSSPIIINFIFMPLQDYPAWELKPRKLSFEEMEKPITVIHDFFSYGHLPEIREQLWELLKTTVAGNYCKILDRRERSNMLYFYEQLEKLVEAVHILHVRDKEEKKDS